MAVSLTSLSLASTILTKRNSQFEVLHSKSTLMRPTAVSSNTIISCSRNSFYDEERNCKKRQFLFGVGALSLSLLSSAPLLAEGMPENYEVFVDKADGYSYYYPSDWRDFDFMGHDSAFKDRYLQLQNVRLSFIPTSKSDIHEMGPLEEVVSHVVNDVYSTPTQTADIMDMQEVCAMLSTIELSTVYLDFIECFNIYLPLIKSSMVSLRGMQVLPVLKNINGRNYYTFEYILTSRNFARAAFATIAVGNGRYYTLIVGANERRWRRVRNKLKVVADSFRLLDI